jgi:hypothetical protein
LFGIFKKAYFVTNFLSTSTQASLGLWIQWVQVKGMLHNVVGIVKFFHGPIRVKEAHRNWYQGCRRMKPKITCHYMPHSTPVNFFINENTYIAFSCVWALKVALQYEVFQRRCANSTG